LLRQCERGGGGACVGTGGQSMLDVGECTPGCRQLGTEAVMKLARDMTFDVLARLRHLRGELAQAPIMAIAFAGIGRTDRDNGR